MSTTYSDTTFLDPIIKQLQHIIGTDYHIEMQDQAVVHWVYRIATPRQTYYLKIRRHRFYRIPMQSTQPEDIRFEYEALQLMGKLMPRKFPKIAAYNKHSGYVLLEEIMLPEENLEHLLNNGGVPFEAWRNIGQAIGDVHHLLAQHPVQLHGDEEDAFFQNKIEHYFQVSNHPVVTAAANSLLALPRQTILGDVSPKNMAITAQGITFCDLESMHYGNVHYELAFALGHALLHNLEKLPHIADIFTALIEGYVQRHPVTLDRQLLMQLSLGICLTRLEQRAIPYNTSFLRRHSGAWYAYHLRQRLNEPLLSFEQLNELF